MTTTVTIELTDEEVARLRAFDGVDTVELMYKVMAALPTPLQVGDRVGHVCHVSALDSAVERIVTWIDPDTNRVHYRIKESTNAGWSPTWAYSDDLFKIEDD